MTVIVAALGAGVLFMVFGLLSRHGSRCSVEGGACSIPSPSCAGCPARRGGSEESR